MAGRRLLSMILCASSEQDIRRYQLPFSAVSSRGSACLGENGVESEQGNEILLTI